MCSFIFTLFPRPRTETNEALKEEALKKPEALPDEYKFPPAANDICKAVGNSCNFDEKKIYLLNHFIPNNNFIFHPVFQEGRNRYVQKHWFWTDPKILAFSQKEHGFFCVPCVLFGSKEVGKGGNQNVGKFVKEPYRRFKDLTEDWANHKKTQYHQMAFEKRSCFLQSLESGSTVIDIAHQGREKEKNKGKKVRAIIWIVQHELPLRGDNDSGDFKDVLSEGMLRSTIRLMADSGDEGAKDLISGEVPRNATYLSPQIQNEIISIISRMLRERISAKINAAKGFSILCDETMSHNREFLSMCIRYIDPFSFEIKEDFVGFVQIYDLSGEGIARNILKFLNNLEIDQRYLIAQGYDGAAAMGGNFRGAQKFIKDEISKLGGTVPEYYHCASHRLNLAVSSAAGTPQIERALAKPTMDALKSADEIDTDGTAEGILTAILGFPTLFAFQLALRVSAILHCLAQGLQAKNIDLIQLVNSVEVVIEFLKDFNSDKFEEVYNETKEMANILGVEEVLKSRNFHGPLKDFLKNNIFTPYLKKLAEELRSRFGNSQVDVFSFQQLKIAKRFPVTIAEYDKDLLEVEIRRCKKKWEIDYFQGNTLPMTIEASTKIFLSGADRESYPSVYSMIKV
uniref:DUF4371 domain-containing protein n=1 Tax=Meloidogyne javanica TaxID=6303 RepID=A0A915LCB8_MELJA